MGSPAPQNYTITGPPLSPEAAAAAMTPPQQSRPAQPVQAAQPSNYTITGPPLSPEAAAAAMTPPAPAAAPSDYTVTDPPLTPATAAADLSPIVVGPATQSPAMAYTETPPVVQQPERQTGFLSGLFSGMGASAREGGQLVTGNAFTDQPGGPQPEPERSWLNSLGYGLGHSAPT